MRKAMMNSCFYIGIIPNPARCRPTQKYRFFAIKQSKRKESPIEGLDIVDSMTLATSSTAADLRKETVQFLNKAGESITVDAIIQDVVPTVPPIGTVVAIHGSPGSHKDFKYITPLLKEKGVRVVGINFPNYGLTAGDARLQYDNTERNNFVSSVMKKVDVDEKVVVMGHSRGCENATGTAADNKDKLAGLVLLNPTGLRLHRGLRPFWSIKLLIWLYDLAAICAAILNPALKFLYNNLLGLRLDSGERAITCVRTMAHIELGTGLRPKIKAINEDTEARVLLAYGAKDFLIETSISRELADSFHDHKEIVCPDQSEEENEKSIAKMSQLFADGTRTVSVNFKKEGHFLQKHRAEFIASSIEAMLKRL